MSKAKRNKLDVEMKLLQILVNIDYKYYNNLYRTDT